MVRGCYDLLVGANVTTDQCSYYEFSDHSQTILLNTVELHIDYTAFSVYTEEGQQNQGKLTFSSDGNISFPTECKKEEQSKLSILSLNTLICTYNFWNTESVGKYYAVTANSTMFLRLKTNESNVIQVSILNTKG